MGEDLVRDARKDVLLLDERRHAHETRHEEHGSRDVAARADDEIGSEVLDDGTRLKDAFHRAPDAQDVRGREAALQPRRVDGAKRDARLRDNIRLQPRLRPDIEELCLWAHLSNGVDDRQCRVDMAARAAARDDDVDLFTHRRAP